MSTIQITFPFQLLLIAKRFQEVHPLLQQASLLVEAWQGNQHQKEYLKVFFLVLQVCKYNFLYELTFSS